MNVKEVLSAFLLVNNPIVLSEEETKDVQKAIKQLQQENKILKENAKHNDKVVDKVNWENMLLKKENKQLKQQLLIAQTNEETFRLEMEDITKTLGLDENTLFDDVKVCVKNLKDNWNKLKEIIKKKFVAQGGFTSYEWNDLLNELLDKMQEMEKNYGNVEDNT